MRVIYFAILSATLSVAMAGFAAHAGEITGKGFPSRASQIAQPLAIQAETASAATPVAVAAPTPAQPGSFAPFADQPLQFSPGERRRARADGQREFRFPSILPALFCVFVVCGLFMTALYLIKKYLPGHRQMFAHPAMEFLGRTHLDQKRFVSILRVGRRIVVVGVSPDEMRTLSEITEEAEVTEILEVARPKTETGLTMFQKLFQRNVVEVEAAEAKAEAEARTAELDRQMSAIREQVKNIRGGEKKKTPEAGPSVRRLDAVV